MVSNDGAFQPALESTNPCADNAVNLVFVVGARVTVATVQQNVQYSAGAATCPRSQQKGFSLRVTVVGDNRLVWLSPASTVNRLRAKRRLGDNVSK